MSQTDPMTVAYLAMGAASYLKDSGNHAPEGHIEMISQITSIEADHQALTALWEDHLDEDGNSPFVGVFLYDVAEVLGYEYAKHIVEGASFDPLPRARELFKEGCVVPVEELGKEVKEALRTTNEALDLAKQLNAALKKESLWKSK